MFYYCAYLLCLQAFNSRLLLLLAKNYKRSPVLIVDQRHCRYSDMKAPLLCPSPKLCGCLYELAAQQVFSMFLLDALSQTFKNQKINI